MYKDKEQNYPKRNICIWAVSSENVPLNIHMHKCQDSGHPLHEQSHLGICFQLILFTMSQDSVNGWQSPDQIEDAVSICPRTHFSHGAAYILAQITKLQTILSAIINTTTALVHTN